MLFTKEDSVQIVESIAAGLRMVGMGEEDTPHIMYPTIANWNPGYMLSSACKTLGFSYTVEVTGDIDKQMKKIRERNSTFINKLTEQARENRDLKSLRINAIISSSEPLTETIRNNIENAWGCKVFDQHGLTELGLAGAIECTSQNGLHIDDADFITEVVDLEAGRRLEPGEKGELVFTTLNLNRGGMLS